MEKPGSNTKTAAVVVQDMITFKGAEYGCEHIQQFLSRPAEVVEKLTNSYTELQKFIAKPSQAQTTKDPKDPKKISLLSLRPTYLCLQCSNVSSLGDRDSHSESRAHAFAIESRSGCLYCSICQDFIYDPCFEKIRFEQIQAASTNNKKRKLSSIYPQGEEDKFLLPNANSLSCQAGAPRGMYNLGQTCYLSVILQALIHNPLMRNHFLSGRHEIAECSNENCIACALTSSFADVLATEKIDGHGPVELLYKSWKSHPGLAGYRQQDAHEYFQFMLDQLHNTSGCTSGHTARACDCLYHQAFFGKLRSTVTCLQCRNITTTEDPIIDLSLDLRQQIKRRKLESKAASMEAPLDLSTCLKSFTNPEKLPIGDYTCKSTACNDTPQRARKHLTIKKLPPTLCIQLKRYEHNRANPQKLDTKLNFPLQLDMSPYTTRAHRAAKKKAGLDKEPLSPLNPSSPLFPRSQGWYDLSSVIVHIGKIEAGHYVCYCRRDDQWFKFDDSKVVLATEPQVLAADAYLLFYIIRNLGAGG